MVPSRLRSLPIFAGVVFICLRFTAADAQPTCRSNGQATYCAPSASDVLFDTSLWSLNSTCNEHRYCELTGGTLSCSTCSSGQFRESYLSDLPADGPSRWQSATLPSASTNVVLDVRFGQQFFLRSLGASFPLRRPAAFYIEKSLNNGTTWQPVAYFAENCLSRYGIDPTMRPTPQTPQLVTCTEGLTTNSDGILSFNWEFQRLNPTTAISAATQRAANPDLRQWLTADRLRVIFDEANRPTASDTNEPLDSFNYFASNDMFLLAACSCNGHAEACLNGRCVCQHNTNGSDCSKCKDFYVDHPWQPALENQTSVFECKRCECNSHSSTCVFNQTLYTQTGSGGLCQNCQHKTTGQHCSRCRPFYYPNIARNVSDTDFCTECGCNMAGVRDSGDCGKVYPPFNPILLVLNGACNCKSNIDPNSRICDTCRETAYNLSDSNPLGCTDCACNSSGTVSASLQCNNVTGQCQCKGNVAGRQCDTCQVQFYGLSGSNTDGCLPCDCFLGGATDNYCHVVSGRCNCRIGFGGRRCDEVLSGYYLPQIDDLRYEAEELTGANSIYQASGSGTAFTGRGYASLSTGQSLVFRRVTVPSGLQYCAQLRYRTSGNSNAFLHVAMRTSGVATTAASCTPSGNFGTPIIFSSGGPMTVGVASRGSHLCLEEGVTYSFNVTATSASHALVDSLLLVPAIESLPEFSANSSGLQQYQRQGCTSHCLLTITNASQISTACRTGQVSALAELYGQASACSCDSDGRVNTTCSSATGQCFCRAGRTGRRCHQCSPEYYLDGTNCLACACDSTGSTSTICEFSSGQCPCYPGRTNRQCSSCQANFYPNPSNTHECLNCTCNPTGSSSLQCNSQGQCQCRNGVGGLKCDTCLDGFFRFSNTGCTACGCDDDGSITNTCDSSGRCSCKSLVLGDKCTRCRQGSHYLHRSNGDAGCRLCNCSGHSSECSTAAVSGLISPGTENCSCPQEYSGMSCERCSNGFTYNNTISAPRATDTCVSCPCNQHSSTCNSVTGACSACQHSTTGNYCERCLPGYYGDATTGTTSDCTRCACPLTSTTDANNLCTRDGRGGFICTNCPAGSTGAHCESCQDGFSGNPSANLSCSDCSCSGNIDPSALGNCNTRTGECLRCINNTAGFTCDRCANNFYGDALVAKNCTACGCVGQGTQVSTICNSVTGDCHCLPNVEGRTCGRCVTNFYNYGASTGCQACNCNSQGSASLQCDSFGRCSCLPGVGGDKCDRCLIGYYSNMGATDCANTSLASPCRACCCDTLNTVANNRSCDSNGQCICRTGSTGQTCDSCSIGFYRSPTTGCQPCQCNNHSDNCSSATSCNNCQHRTIGNQCQTCEPGYYGNARRGTTSDCQPCQCNGFATTCTADGGDFICNSCSGNTTGRHCDQCLVNYYGSPTSGVACLSCGEKCNNNADLSAADACHNMTGQCLRCLYNTTGDGCQLCQLGYHGDALSQTCQACRCNAVGSADMTCDRSTGVCQCRPNVQGPQCTQCIGAHYNFNSGLGCTACACNATGSRSAQCTDSSGQCPCRDRVVGRQCDQCRSDSFQLSTSGCTACACNQTGTVSGSTRCNSITGQCECEPGTGGSKCDRCTAGYYWVAGAGCQLCLCNNQSTTCNPINGICSNCSGNTDGANCEFCASEFYRLGADCVPCGCHNLGTSSNICNRDNGQCSCRANVDSSTRTCSVCNDNFYGISRQGCQACNCHGPGTAAGTLCNKAGGQCACNTGFNGRQCDTCDRLYYSIQLNCPACNCSVQGATSSECNIQTGQCNCRNNVDGRRCDSCLPDFYNLANPGGCLACNCDTTGSMSTQCNAVSGVCTCKAGVDGDKCDRCGDRFYGFGSSGCSACNCNMNGSRSAVCDKTSGQCPCYPNVLGRQCANCQGGTRVLENGSGCTPCQCNPLGTFGQNCSQTNGQCACRPGVGGLQCGQCIPGYYGFPNCQACNCNTNGSANISCDDNARCFCRPNALGDKCSTCAENYHMTTSGCRNCPSCYDLAQAQVTTIRNQLSSLTTTLNSLTNDSLLVNFSLRLNSLDQQTDQLQQLAKSTGDLTDDLLINISHLSVALTQDSQTYTQQYFNSRINSILAVVSTSSSQFTVANSDIRRTENLLISSHNLITGTLAAQMAQLNTTVQRIVDLRVLHDRTTTAIEQRARILQAEVQQIASHANQALVLANQSLDAIERALTRSIETADRLNSINTALKNSQDVLAVAVETLTRATTTQQQASNALQNATAVFNLPDVSNDWSRSRQFRQEAESLQQQNIDLQDTYAETTANVSSYDTISNRLNSSVGSASTAAEILLRRASASNTTAQPLADAAFATQRNAQEMLSILQNFRETTSAAQQQAQQSLANVSRVNATAAQVERDSRDILTRHQSAGQQALLAANISQDALQSSNSAVQHMTNQVQFSNITLETTRQTQRGLQQANTSLTSAMQEITRLTSSCIAQLGVAVQLESQALAEQDNGNNASVLAVQARRESEQLLSDLQNISSIDTQRISQLSSQLDRLGRTFTQVQIDTVFNSLQAELDNGRERLALTQIEISANDQEIQQLTQTKIALNATCPP